MYFTCAPLASIWVVILHILFLYSDPPLPCHPPFYCLRLFSSQTFSPYEYSNIFKPSHPSSLPAYKDGTDRVFRNVGIQTSDAWELPRRKHTTFGTRRKFEIMKSCIVKKYISKIYLFFLILRLFPI